MNRKQFFFWIKLRRSNIRRAKKGYKPIKFNFRLIESLKIGLLRK